MLYIKKQLGNSIKGNVHRNDIYRYTIFGSVAEKKDLRTYANNKEPDPRSLVWIFAIRIHNIGTLLYMAISKDLDPTPGRANWSGALPLVYVLRAFLSARRTFHYLPLRRYISGFLLIIQNCFNTSVNRPNVRKMSHLGRVHTRDLVRINFIRIKLIRIKYLLRCNRHVEKTVSGSGAFSWHTQSK